jgi:hypothetical protein
MSFYHMTTMYPRVSYDEEKAECPHVVDKPMAQIE